MPRLHPTSTPIQERSAVIIEKGKLSLHSGVAYRLDDEPPRYLHLAWHLKLLGQKAVPSQAHWVQPALSRAQSIAVAVQSDKVARRYAEGGGDYGFTLTGVSILHDGTIDLAGGVGLTCASFLVVLFASVSVPLLHIETWSDRSERRIREDTAVQKRLVRQLRKKHMKQATRLAKEIGNLRIRPEEVAGASGLHHRPVAFSIAEAAGQDILRQLS